MVRRQWSLFGGVSILIVLAASGVHCTQEEANDGNDSETPTVWVLSADPANLTLITEGYSYDVNLTLSFNGTEPLPYDASSAMFIVKVSLTNPLTVSLDTDRIEFTWEDVSSGNNKTLNVTAQIIGYVDLNFHLQVLSVNGSEGTEILSEERPLLIGYLATVIRESNLMDNIFTIVMATLAVLNTINMGCALDLQVVKQCILRPVGPIVGFISQFTFMPLFSLGMALLLIEDPLKGFGLLVIGVCPGGLASNFWTLLLDGDVNLSITMTFVSSIAAMGMMPLWLWLLSGYFLPEGSAVKVPYVDMTISLVLLTVPLGIGLLIRRWKRNVAEFLSNKVMKPFSFIFIAIMFGLGFYSLSHIFVLLDWKMLVAGLCVAGAGFIFGGMFAWIARLTKAQIVAVSLETAMQNGNVAFVLLKMSVPAPYSDIAALPPIAQILMTSGILFILYAIHLLIKCCVKRLKSDKKEVTNVEDAETVRALMGDEKTKTVQLKEFQNGKNANNNYGGSAPSEFAWTQNSNLIVPNSPSVDPRAAV